MELNEADVLTLILAVLDRDGDAHRILADLLEEAGQPGAAQHARARKSKTQKRIDFALTVIPARMAIGIACEFLQSEWKIRYRKSEDAVSLLDDLRVWAADAPKGNIDATLNRLTRLRADERHRLEIVDQTRLNRTKVQVTADYFLREPVLAWELMLAVRELLKREQSLGRRVWFCDATAVNVRRIIELSRLSHRQLDPSQEKMALIRERLVECLANLES